MNKLTKYILTGCAVIAALPIVAQEDYHFVATGNPIATHKFMGDPAALVHDGTLYIYAGHDECPAPEQYYLMNEWVILSTKADWRCCRAADE